LRAAGPARVDGVRWDVVGDVAAHGPDRAGAFGLGDAVEVAAIEPVGR
jgi:hypothetical protein